MIHESGGDPAEHEDPPSTPGSAARLFRRPARSDPRGFRAAVLAVLAAMGRRAPILFATAMVLTVVSVTVALTRSNDGRNVPSDAAKDRIAVPTAPAAATTTPQPAGPLAIVSEAGGTSASPAPRAPRRKVPAVSTEATSPEAAAPSSAGIPATRPPSVGASRQPTRAPRTSGVPTQRFQPVPAPTTATQTSAPAPGPQPTTPAAQTTSSQPETGPCSTTTPNTLTSLQIADETASENVTVYEMSANCVAQYKGSLSPTYVFAAQIALGTHWELRDATSGAVIRDFVVTHQPAHSEDVCDPQYQHVCGSDSGAPGYG